MRVVALLCAVVALLAAACAPKGETPVKDSAATAAPPVVDVAAVRQAIEQANAKQADALNRGDSTGLVANYADDAVLMFPGEPAWRGRNEIGANGVKLRLLMASRRRSSAKRKFISTQRARCGRYS